MRLPSAPDEPKPRDPSYPDRARIDSDVRELMRIPSSPWIVFDRDSRVPRDEIARQPSMFPIETAPAEPVIEPSNCVVATDVMSEQPYLLKECAVVLPPPIRTRSPRVLIACAIAGAVGLVAMIACVISAHPTSSEPKAAAVTPPRATVPVDPSPPNLDLPPPPVDDNAGATTTTPAPPDPAQDRSVETDPKKKFGRLTIKGAAVGKQVFIDGKRLLGTGTRTFTVFCGEHTIAVNDKDAARDVTIPCNGELTISR